MRVQLLGGFRLVYGEEPVNGVGTVRLQSLLSYLILNANNPLPRQQIAFTLWPDSSEANARNNLRQFLFQLRHSLPDVDQFLSVDANLVCWHQNGDQLIDVRRFESCLAEAEQAAARGDLTDERRWLGEALSVYQGDLLPGCYDEWVLPCRDQLRQRFLEAHHKLVGVLEQQRDYPEALRVAKALVGLDPLDENASAALIRLYALNRNPSAAKKAYQSAVETLRRELGVGPGEILRQAYERLAFSPLAPPSQPEPASLSLVGRQNEWRRLQSAWERASIGQVQIVEISGEAGIGKSRLAEELFTWVGSRGSTAARARSYAAEGRLSLGPVVEWLRSPALRPHINHLDDIWLTEVARLLPELLNEKKSLAHPMPIGEYGQRQHFFEALTRAVLAAPPPVLLWIDDLQWCDLDTLEWLHFLLRFQPQMPLLVVGTARIEESLPDHPLTALVHQLQAEGKLVSIELSPLDAAETARLASQINGRELELGASLRLFQETEGNPLFIVETVRSNIARSSDGVEMALPQAPQDTSNLPPRVYAVIAGRLAQLSPVARRVTELGAAIGREFSLDVLLHAGQADEATAVRALEELWQKRILREQRANVYDFTHDKLRDVAYAETSAPQRRLLHRQIAQALEWLYAERLDEVSAQIAAQYEQAGLVEQALPYYRRAGEVAAGIYANENAIQLYQHGLALLSSLPPGQERDQQELVMQMALATLFRLSKGWASRDEERVLTRLMQLCQQVGSVEQRINTLFGVQTLYVVRAQYAKVEETYREAEHLYSEAYGTAPPPFAAISLAGARMFMGRLQESREQFEQIIAVRDDKQIRDLQESQGLNYLVHGQAWNAHGVWCLGFPAEALRSARAAVDDAREFAQPFNQALAMTYMAMLMEWCANPDEFRVQAEEAHTLSSAIKATYYQTWANILVCFARASQQPEIKHVKQLEDAIRAFTDTGAHVRLPVYFSLLARACLASNQVDLGFEALNSGLRESRQNNECWWDAELHRVRGELLARQGGDPGEVEAAFQQSLQIARTQEARSLELRAAISLARVWRASGKSAQVRPLLAPLHAAFPGGADTPDLWAARSLLTKST